MRRNSTPFQTHPQSRAQGHEQVSQGGIPRRVEDPNYHHALILTVTLTQLTLLAAVFLHLDLVDLLSRYFKAGNISGVVEQIVFVLIIVVLIYGNLLYQFTRWGYFRRLAAHRRARWEEMESIFDGKAPSLTLLVPSYKEDVEAALQDYRRPASLFRVNLSSFEHKRYINLSHEANKAMNLNSYIGLMGRSFREI